jgi:hypothetical protein
MLSSLFPAVSSRLIICIKSYARKLTPLERSLVVVGPVVYSLVSFFGPSPARSKNQDYARNLAGAQRNVHGEDSACPTTGISPLCLLPCPFHPFSSLSPSSVPRVPAPRLGSDPQKTTARPHPALPSLRARTTQLPGNVLDHHHPRRRRHVLARQRPGPTQLRARSGVNIYADATLSPRQGRGGGFVLGVV